MPFLGDSPDDDICYSLSCNYWVYKGRPLQVIYVCLYRLKDREAWAVRQAYGKKSFENGDWVVYRDNGLRDFDAKVISKTEYETFKIFDKVGRE